MSKTAISLRDSDALAAPSISSISKEQLDLIKRTVAQGANDDELRLFLYDCQRQGTHPLDKLIHFTKRGGRYTPITSIDFMRMRAADTGELAGNDDPEYEFRGDEDVIPYRASVTVWKLVQGQRCPFKATARWAEYCPARGQDHMWLKMPQLMLGKCAEALALRKAFPKQLHGLYERAEMEQAQDLTREVARKEVSGAPTIEYASTSHERPQSPQTTTAQPQPPREDTPDEATVLFPDPNEDVEREQIWNQITLLSKRIEATKTTKKDKDAWRADKDAAWKTNCGDATPSTADLSSLNDLLNWLKTREPKDVPNTVRL